METSSVESNWISIHFDMPIEIGGNSFRNVHSSSFYFICHSTSQRVLYAGSGEIYRGDIIDRQNVNGDIIHKVS